MATLLSGLSIEGTCSNEEKVEEVAVGVGGSMVGVVGVGIGEGEEEAIDRRRMCVDSQEREWTWYVSYLLEVSLAWKHHLLYC